ncbi:hypothetical protein GOODEAATRI_001864 [Goodea atripinnis]|uniref:Uncharacterized protein n=1 Tax=Goodea atripinnis TaxID=208336 RepID=A0ABV0N794_9TELE
MSRENSAFISLLEMHNTYLQYLSSIRSHPVEFGSITMDMEAWTRSSRDTHLSHVILGDNGDKELVEGWGSIIFHE